MDRRRFLAAATGGIAAFAGCASSESTGPTDPEPAATDPGREPSPERVYRGPTVTARATGTPTAPGPTTPAVATSTETVTPGSTDTPGSDAGGSSGGSGGSGGSNPASPATSTPTVTSAESERSPPIQLGIFTANMDRVVGELSCTAGPLAWMVVEIEFQRAGDPVASERLRRDEPATGETLSFEVESGTADPDRVRITTAYAYPES